jgi:hypothetical protein
MSIQLSNLRSLTYNSATNIANFSGSVVVANNLGINVATPSYTLVVGGDIYTSGSFFSPNNVYQILQGAGTSPTRTYTAANQVFGKNYDSGTTGYLTSQSANGVSNTVGSGWVDGNWYSPKTGKYLVDIFMFINSLSKKGTRWMLNVYNSSDVLKYQQFIFIDRYTQSSYAITTNHSTFLNMNSGDYFNISINNFIGNTDLYYSGLQFSIMKISQLS